jgi:hypothetical protein
LSLTGISAAILHRHLDAGPANIIPIPGPRLSRPQRDLAAHPGFLSIVVY